MNGESHPAVSRNQLDQAGSRVRRAVDAGEPVPDAVLETVNRFRAWHLESLTEVQRRLFEGIHAPLGEQANLIPITSRLKTPEAIVAKLARITTSLTRMQDIAGARMVAPALDLQDSLLPAVESLFEQELVTVKDQREEPDEHGYRAIHVIVHVGGRFAEIQLRTIWQDKWAQVVEAIDSQVIEGVLEKGANAGATLEELRTQIDLKHGVGPADLLSWLLKLSDEFRKADLGLPYEFPAYPGQESGRMTL